MPCSPRLPLHGQPRDRIQSGCIAAIRMRSAEEHVLVDGLEGDEGKEATHELGDNAEVNQVGQLFLLVG